jgi:hypothetical protein
MGDRGSSPTVVGGEVAGEGGVPKDDETGGLEPQDPSSVDPGLDQVGSIEREG